LPLVARLVNELELDLRHAHFWGMDEWVIDGREVPEDFALSFAKADRDLLFNRIRPELRMPERTFTFPRPTRRRTARPGSTAAASSCRAGRARSSTGPSTIRPSAKGSTRTSRPARGVPQAGHARVDLHPMTIIQNARTSGGGVVTNVPTQAITVGPAETWQAEKVSIWHAGAHDNPFGQRLTALMIAKRIPDSSVPMSLLADHPNVQFNYYRGGIGVCEAEMH
jgi:glucosamine-6-phosphate deaminase